MTWKSIRSITRGRITLYLLLRQQFDPIMHQSCQSHYRHQSETAEENNHNRLRLPLPIAAPLQPRRRRRTRPRRRSRPPSLRPSTPPPPATVCLSVRPSQLWLSISHKTIEEREGFMVMNSSPLIWSPGLLVVEGRLK